MRRRGTVATTRSSSPSLSRSTRRALEDDSTAGQRLELCGPDSYTLQELVEYTRDTLGMKQRIIGLGNRLSRLQARMLGIMPGKPFSMDNYYSLQTDSLCKNNALPALGITPTPIAAGSPSSAARIAMCELAPPYMVMRPAS